jgi:heme/copper-type cytochrome/quinol oxidase subunit 1
MQDVEGATPAPPVGEQIHMPAPSRLPILNAAGLALAIVSITISRIGVVVGLAVFLVTTVLWIRAASRELDELPAEHHGGH